MVGVFLITSIRYEIFELMFGYDMFEKYKNNFKLQLKKIEINYRSWKNAQEIAKAYNKDVSLKKTYSAFLETHLRKIVIYSSIFIISIVLTTGVWITIVQVKKGLSTISIKKSMEKKSLLLSRMQIDKRKTIKPEHQVSYSSGNNVDTQKNKNIALSLPNNVAVKSDYTSSDTKKNSRPSFIDKIKMLFSKLNYRTVAVSDSQLKKSIIKKSDSQVVVKESSGIYTCQYSRGTC